MKRIFVDILAVALFFVMMAAFSIQHSAFSIQHSAFSDFDDMRTTIIQTILFGLVAVPFWRFLNKYFAKKR